MKIVLVIIFSVYSYGLRAQIKRNFIPLLKESRTYTDSIWQKEEISNCQILLTATENNSEFQFIVNENTKTIIFNLNPSGNVYNWISKDGKEYKMFLYQGQDVKQDNWNIEIYTPKEETNKHFIILYNKKIIIKYKM